MKKGTILELIVNPKINFWELPELNGINHHRLSYLGIERDFLLFGYFGKRYCKILVPKETRPVRVLNYLFDLEHLSKEKIVLKYVGKEK